MLMSLLGRPTDRAQAKKLFLVHRNPAAYPGASLDDIRQILIGTGTFSLVSWLHFDSMSTELISKRLRARIGIALPTVISFGIVHPTLKIRSRHTAVLLSASNESIELLDPLARPPDGKSAGNVAVEASGHVVGSSYLIDRRAAVAMLDWRARAA